jgi:Berberine and berberine like
MTAYFHQQIPRVNDEGGMGYYYIASNVPTEPDPAQKGKLYGVWIFPNKTSAEGAAILKPMEDHIRAASWGGDKATAGSIFSGPSIEFNQLWSAIPPGDVGVDSRLGSWLLSKEALSKDLNTLKTQFRKAGAPEGAPNALLGHVIAGRGVRNAKIPGGSNAVLPAWRNAYTHVVRYVTWPYLNSTAKAAATTLLRDVYVPALKKLQTDSGAYMNEADPTNPEWENDFYGANYKRLLRIKNQWDPSGVFWCKPCVGHELWEIKNWAADGQGVGQDVERLCRKV